MSPKKRNRVMNFVIFSNNYDRIKICDVDFIFITFYY